MPRNPAAQGRVDANQSDIIRVLQAAGCTVVVLSAVGGGVPDLLVGHCGRNYLFEVKDPVHPASKRKLNPKQQEFFERWAGQAHVITTAGQALKAIGSRYRVRGTHDSEH